MKKRFPIIKEKIGSIQEKISVGRNLKDFLAIPGLSFDE
jgi:hypothetical protein